MFDTKDEVSYAETLSSTAPSARRQAAVHTRGPETVPIMVELGHDAHAQERSGNFIAYDVCKRFVDIFISLTALLIGFPVFLLIALAIKRTDKGPVLFKQRRLGKDGREFWCYKFRTMVRNAEEVLAERTDLQEQFQDGFKIKNDPRVTSVGRFLRRSSMDELPQFFNVLVGDMSLIGPRPIVPPELSKYGRYAQKLLSVKPGLSGLWQATGRSDLDYDGRVRLDMRYIDTRSTRLDLKLIALTCVAVLRKRGAY